MRKLFLLLTFIVFAGTAISCGSPYTRLVDPKVFNTGISEDEAAIVFLRQNKTSAGLEIMSSMMTGLLPLIPRIPIVPPAALIFEVKEDENLKFVAHLDHRTKFLYRTTPGKHLYVVIDRENFLTRYAITNIKLLEVNLEAEKTYYVYVSQYSIYSPQCTVITAIDLSSQEFIKDFKSLDWYETKPSILEDYSKKTQRFSHQIKKYSIVNHKDKVQILPEYGTNTPIR